MYGSYWRYDFWAERDSDDNLSGLLPSAASGADIYVFTAKEPMRVTRFCVQCLTTISGTHTTDAVYIINHRSVNGSTSTEKMSVTIPGDACSAGMTFYNEDNAFDVNVGEQVTIGHSVASTTSAGTVMPYFQAYKRAETTANQSYMTKVSG